MKKPILVALSFAAVSLALLLILAVGGVEDSHACPKGEEMRCRPMDKEALYRQRAEQGEAGAQYEMGELYHYGYGVSRDYKEALRWYGKAAVQGNARAQHGLGEFYYYGYGGVSQDKGEAARWYRRAAEWGLAKAQKKIGMMYAEGEGVSQDYILAHKWHNLLAARGDVDARKGREAVEGKMTPSQIAEALRLARAFKPKEVMRLYQKAAEQGEALAQYEIGEIYYIGLGVLQDKREAARWLRKAAEQGNAEAQHRLGEMYYSGDGVSQDKGEAMRWYSKAAEQGDATAQASIGFMYAKGEGVAQDYILAHKWYTLAATRDARRGMGEVERRMTPAEIAEAQRLAREFKPKKEEE